MTDPPAAVPSRPGWIRILGRACLVHRADFVFSFGAALLASTIAAVTPLIARHVVDEVAGGRGGPLWPWLVALLALGALRFGAGFTRRFRAGRMALSVQHDLRQRILTSLQRLDGRRQDGLQTGQVVSRAISDLNIVQGLLGFIPNLVGNLLMFAVSLVIMAVLSPPLTLVALAVGPIVWIVARGSRRQLFPANWHAQNESGVLAGRVEGAVTGVRVVKGFGQEDRELGRIESLARDLFASRMRVVRLTGRWNPMLQAVPALGQVGVIALGGWLALHGQVSLGTFLAFSAYVTGLVAPVRLLAGFLTIGQQARAGVDRIMEIVEQEPVIHERPGAVEIPDRPVDLELRGVRFGYAADRPVLDGLDLRVRPGETLALVGASGSGTSTVAALVARFYDVDDGSVTVNGVDVRDAATASLRRRVGVVFQDSFLYSDTLRANLAYGRPGATDTEILAAARAAAVDFVDDLPDGLDTLVGEQGLTLSGGQRQRVALARALLSDPRLLVLDDTTSAVDPETENAIHDALRALGGDRTVLLVAHRRSTLALADRVALLEDGRVTDLGTAAELEERSARFRALLAGPGEDDEPVPAGPAETYVEGAVTPELWRPVEESGPRPSSLAVATMQSQVRGAPGRGGGMVADAALTPELAGLLDALPAATDAPDVDVERAREADTSFNLRRLLRPLRWPLVFGLGLAAVDAGAQTLLPWLVRHAVDAGVTRAATGVLFGTALVALLVVLGDWLVTYGQIRVAGRTGERLLYTLRVKTFAHLQRLGLDYYERELGGRIMTRMTTDVDALSTFLQTGLATAVVSVLSLVTVLVAMIVLDAPLALTVGVLVPVLLLATLRFRHLSVPVYAASREAASKVNAYFQEAVAGLRVSQMFVQERRDADRFAALSADYRDTRLTAQRYIATYFPFVEFLGEIAVALVLWAGASRVESGTLTAGALIAFLLYVDLFFSPVQQLSQVFDSYQQAAVGLHRVSELLRTPTTTPQRPDAYAVGALAGDAAFDRVGFRYDADAPEALHDFTVEVPPGETVAVVGATGAGKSSAMKLLARFYDPTAGTVRVDGHDLRDLDLTAYRHRLGYVPQEAYLFDGTIRDAIAYGRPEASDAEVEAAAHRVGAHAMIARLAGGYLHPVGERGRGLSAGQRQLVALARAELVDPDLLLLDEATASLDLESEAAVVRAGELLTHRRTTVLIAHRLQTAARADRILVLDHGRLVEDGTHEDLLAAGGTYERLWAAYGGRALTT